MKHQKLEKIRTQFLSPVTTSPHGDKVVSIGDIVMLKNLHLSHSVAIFSDNQIHFSVTGETKHEQIQNFNWNLASSEAGAQTRNTFKVVPYAGELDDICLGSPLRYNQVFCLQSVCNPDFYLASDSIRKLNTLSNIAYGRNEVFLVDKKSRVSSISGWTTLKPFLADGIQLHCMGSWKSSWNRAWTNWTKLSSDH